METVQLLSKEFENDTANESASDSDMPDLESDYEYNPSIDELSDISSEDFKENNNTNTLEVFEKMYKENTNLLKQNEELKLTRKNEEINDLMSQRNILLVISILQTTYLCFNC